MAFREDLIHELREVVEVYRLVRTLDQDDPEWLRSFMSRAQLGVPPRPTEERHPVLMDGISVSRDFEKLRKDGLRLRERRPHLGGGVARMVLEPGLGFEMAEWGAPGHLTIWGESERLAASVVATLGF